MNTTTPAPANARTWPSDLLARDVTQGTVWAERLLAQVRACAGDGARFVAGMQHGS